MPSFHLAHPNPSPPFPLFCLYADPPSWPKNLMLWWFLGVRQSFPPGPAPLGKFHNFFFSKGDGSRKGRCWGYVKDPPSPVWLTFVEFWLPGKRYKALEDCSDFLFSHPFRFSRHNFLPLWGRWKFSIVTYHCSPLARRSPSI